MMLQIKFGCNRPAGLRDIHVWKCGRTHGCTHARMHARTPARVPSYKLTLWAFGSGEQKIYKKKTSSAQGGVTPARAKVKVRNVYLGLQYKLLAKPTKWHVRPVKSQISLGIRPIWSGSSLSAWRKLGSLATQWAHSEYADKSGWMPRLIWVFAGHIVILLVLSY